MADFIIHCPNCNHQFEPGDSIREEVQRELRGQMVDWQKKKDEEFKQKEQSFQQQLQLKDEETIKKIAAEKRNLKKTSKNRSVKTSAPILRTS